MEHYVKLPLPLSNLMQVNEEAARNELFSKPGRVNIEERRRQRAAQRNPAYRIGENLAGKSLPLQKSRIYCQRGCSQSATFSAGKH